MNLSRREFARTCALGGLGFASRPLLGFAPENPFSPAADGGPASRVLKLDSGWLFGGKFDPAALEPGFGDSAFLPVSVPHCVARLSWRKWAPEAWQDVWIYRRHFAVPEAFRGMRVFLEFDAVMIRAAPTVNGHALEPHAGGYLPFRREVTGLLKEGDNVLALVVDARWMQVPPEGHPKGPRGLDYLEPGGITRSVRLAAVPPIHVSDVFARPVDVLGSGRRVEVACSLDAAAPAAGPARIRVELKDGARVLSRSEAALNIEKAGVAQAALTLGNLGGAALWDVDAPRIYQVVTTLLVKGQPRHVHRVRIGLRDARFALDGFFLNGRRLQLFGLNRHEIYPYVGGAMPRRVKRRDAEILKRDFHCNIVRCSHYPQSREFLDACDELGLMVWQETPGWQYLGDQAWKDLVVRDVREMVLRDRNRPSVVIWGVRVNESANDPELYRRTTEIAKSLDPSRPASGSMTPESRRDWKTRWREDVFAYDDYHADADGGVGILPPVPGCPYLLAETVGQFNYAARRGFNAYYRRDGDPKMQQEQALRHAQAHSKAAADPRNCGVIAWCAFEYGSLVNAYDAVKNPGVADVFRIPKLGASFYLAQGDPAVRPVIEPNFYWDFGPRTPKGPGPKAAIFSNCERLEVFVDGNKRAVLLPDSEGYPHLAHPPFFADLEIDGGGRPELRIDGYVGNTLALSRSFSSDAGQDRFMAEADDAALVGDGSDATRIAFRVADKFGAPRAFGEGEVSLEIAGPGGIVGDNPFSLGEAGGAGAVWVRSAAGATGRISVRLRHSTLGTKEIAIDVTPAEPA